MGKSGKPQSEREKGGRKKKRKNRESETSSKRIPAGAAQALVEKPAGQPGKKKKVRKGKRKPSSPNTTKALGTPRPRKVTTWKSAK